MNEDAFLIIGISRESEQVLLSDGAIGVGLAAAKAAGAGIPIVLPRQVVISRNLGFAQTYELRQVGGKFVVGHDTEPSAALNHRLTNFRALGEHLVDQERGLLEGVGIHLE